MKRILILAVSLALAAASIQAETLYVTSRLCPIFQEPSTGSKRLGEAAQGDELKSAARSGDWIKATVSASGIEGYVQALFTGAVPSVKRAATADALKSIASVVTRRRANAYTTSAAATRGLASDNVHERENLSFKDYDFTAIAWFDTFVFSDEEILAFARSEGIGL